MQRFARVLAVIAGFLAIFTPVAAMSDEILVFAASSLREAMIEVGVGYTEVTGIEVVLVSAASSAIARQVASGAPADVALLADERWANWLIEEGALNASNTFASNRLVLVSAQPLGITDAGDIVPMLGDERLAMGLLDAVPAGDYGRAALTQLGLWKAIEPQIVQSPNVRAALRLVQRGEALMGIGYVSDLVAFPDLFALYEFGMDAPPVAIYSGAGLTQQGSDFMSYLQDAEGQRALQNWGFLPPPAE